VDDLPEKARAMRAALDAIESGEAEVSGLESAAAAARKAWEALAETASARARRRAGWMRRWRRNWRRSSWMPRAFAPPSPGWRKASGAPRGWTVEFLIATNPGADFALGQDRQRRRIVALHSGAESGTGRRRRRGLMIFDEIDRGVGGAVAQAIGERLARLADKGQLLAVTHSPQVAARGRSTISSPNLPMAR
jgi:DNA repair protein RecN (Recombination protein N)